MVNMLPSVLGPFLPIVWALVASVVWWRRFPSPWLFLVTALFALFGIQSIVSFLWAYWPALEAENFVPNNSGADAQRHLEEMNRIAIAQAFIVLTIAVPFLKWLKGGMSFK